MRIAPAAEGTFKLVFAPCSTGVEVRSEGSIRLVDRQLYLEYGRNRDHIGEIDTGSITLRTFHRNTVPFYRRYVGNELWISNDVLQLIHDEEQLRINELHLVLAAKNKVRSVFSHLLEDIELLLPSSEYHVRAEAGGVVLSWENLDFSILARITADVFLDYLIDRYQQRYGSEDEIELAMSGGGDTRFELAMMSYLRKRVRCYHLVTGAREADVARLVAEAAGASYQQFPLGQMQAEGWDLLGELGYLGRWDGFFAPGALQSAGLYLQMANDHPETEKLLLNTTNGFKGRLYEEKNLHHLLLSRADVGFSSPFLQERIDEEKRRRLTHLDQVYQSALSKTDEHDRIVDLVYTFAYKSDGKINTRATYLYENGMPVLDGDRATREMFSAIPRASKEGYAFNEHAIERLCPRLNSVPRVTSAMSWAERDYGAIARVPVLRQMLKYFARGRRDTEQTDFLVGEQVRAVIEALPIIGHLISRTRDPRNRLALAQIVRFLAECQERKRVTFEVA